MQPIDSGKTDTREDTRADRLWMLAIFVAAAALYLTTCCRTVYWYDSAEYATAAYSLGVPHPPGYPLYMLIAHAFVALLPVSAAYAVNLMSACFGALAVALCFCSARALGAGRLAAAASAALLGSGESFWLNATIAEVYAPGLCCVFGVLLLLLRAKAQGRPATVIGAAALAGASLGVHYSLATLGLGWVWLAAQPVLSLPSRSSSGTALDQARRLTALAGASALAVLAGYASVFAYVVVRAGSDAVPNQASPPSLARLAWLLSGGNYRTWFLTQYDVLARAGHVLSLIAHELSVPGFALALFGLGFLARTQRALAIGLALAAAGNVAFFFRYRVDDLEVFLLPSVALLAACAGVAAQAFADWLQAHARATKRRREAPPRCHHRQLALLVPVLLLGLAGSRLVAGYAQHDLRRFDAAERYAQRLAVSLPRNAVIVHYATPDEWKYHSVFGLYFQHVLQVRRDVVVVANVDRPVLDRLLQERRPTYLYSRVEHVSREYALAPEGDLWRLLYRF